MPPGPPRQWEAESQWTAPVPTPRRRRRRSLRLLLGVLAAGALVGGTVVAVVTATAATAPSRVVERYFAALRAGDAPAALRFGPDPVGNHDFLTSSVLAVQEKLATIDDVQVASTTVSGRTARVGVTYRLTPAAGGGAASTQQTTVPLHRLGRGWQLNAAAASVRVVVTAAGHRATLAGSTIPAIAVALFPGAVPVQYDTGLLQQQPDPSYVALDSSGDVRVGARLSPAGVAAVEAAVRRTFTSCLAQGAAAPRSCPLTPDGYRVVPGSLRGTLTRTTFDHAPDLRAGDADGLVEATGTFAIRGRYQSLDFDNIASTTAGSVTVSFRARTYTTSPGVLAWELP